MTRRSTVALAAITALLALAFILNPSPDRHRAKIKEAIAQRSPLAGAIGLGSLAAFASTYHSVGLASYTTAGDRTLSWGAFGLVVVAPQK